MSFVVLTLIAATTICCIAGAAKLSQFAFRLGALNGILVLLCPPYTFYFAFYKLEQESKDKPTALWFFGLITTILLLIVFLPDS